VAYKVLVMPPVSRKLGSLDFSRQVKNTVLSKVYAELQGEEVETYRANRSPGREDDYFVFEQYFGRKGRRLRLTFHVNDRTAPGTLMVEDLTIDPWSS
jgi:hypothetical protein